MYDDHIEVLEGLIAIFRIAMFRYIELDQSLALRFYWLFALTIFRYIELDHLFGSEVLGSLP